MTGHSKWDDSNFKQNYQVYLSWIKSLEILWISTKFPLSYDIFKSLYYAMTENVHLLKFK